MNNNKMIQKQGCFRFIFLIVFLLATWLPLTGNAAVDSDGDGILDNNDNCAEVSNPNQRNTDGDNYGNLCDGDLNNDNKTNTLDLNLYKLAHRSNLGDINYNPHADFNGDNKINTIDLNIYKNLHRKPPGPGASSGVSKTEASRFLTQSTFGPTTKDIQHLVDLKSNEAWLNEQFNLPPSFHRPLIKTPVLDSKGDHTGQYGHMDTWWDVAVFGKDQLRQRIAFALSEILVISDLSDPIEAHRDTVAEYYDILIRHSFGNFRDLLQDVTLSPAMGIYLSMLGNDKPDPNINRRADENYAREFMQLFSIGLVQLNTNGTPKLSSSGKPIPTYTQSDVENLARILTGWAWDLNYHTGGSWAWWDHHEILLNPMVAFPNHHDQDKKLFLGKSFTAGQTAQQDLDKALDIIFNHPNVGPFISKQLIMRLVTSNPSPTYVARVANIFNNNGQGVRGDLKAVTKAILLDQEARSAPSNHFGKLREPLLRLTHLWRAFKASGGLATENWIPDFVNYQAFHYYWPESEFSQAPMRSPSVFNFFRPDFSPAGKIKTAGLIAPEFQITSESRLQNLYEALIDLTSYDGFDKYVPAALDLSAETALANNPGQLINHLDLLLTSGGMSSKLRQILVNYINTNRTKINDDERLSRDLIILIMTSAEYSIQR